MAARFYEDWEYKEIRVNKSFFTVTDAPTLCALRDGRMLLVTYSIRDIRARELLQNESVCSEEEHLAK